MAERESNTLVEVFNTSSRGRAIRSRVPLRTGREVILCDPYVFVSRSDMMGKICDQCLLIKDCLKRCSACKMVYYCGHSCQKMGWKMHMLECKYMKQILPKIPSDTVRLLALLLLKNREKNEEWLQQLTTHYEEIKAEKREIFVHILVALQKYLDMTLGIESEVIFEQFCKINCNAFTICDGEMKPVGLGLYPTASFINHSCQPNCVAVFLGARCFIRAIEDIAFGEELTLGYTELLSPHHVRRKELKKQYFFYCTCNLCKQEATHGTKKNGLKCPNEKCSNPVGFQPDDSRNRCTSCGTELLSVSCSPFITELYQKIEKTLSACKSIDSEPVQLNNILRDLENELTDAEKILHSCNYQIIRLVDRASDICIDMGLWSKALSYCKRSLVGYEEFYPKNHPSIGLQLYRIGKLEVYLDMLDTGFTTLSQAKSVLSICHGKKHALTQQLDELLYHTGQEINLLRAAEPKRMLQT